MAGSLIPPREIFLECLESGVSFSNLTSLGKVPTVWTKALILDIPVNFRFVFEDEGELAVISLYRCSDDSEWNGIPSSVAELLGVCSIALTGAGIYCSNCLAGGHTISTFEPVAITILPTQVSVNLHYKCTYSYKQNHAPACERIILSTRLELSVEPVFTLPSCLGALHSGALSDLTLRVEKGEKDLKTHQFVLAASSPVFNKMFDNKQCLESQQELVTIKDFNVEVVEAVLSYLYTHNLGTLEPNTLVDVLVFAEKYEIEEVKALCEKLLAADSSLDEAELFSIAVTNNATKLKEAILMKLATSENRTSFLSKERITELALVNMDAVVELVTWCLSAIS